MKSEDLRFNAQRLREEGNSYGEIAKILGITRFCARSLIIYKLRKNKKKIGCKSKITKRDTLSLKREIARLNAQHEKVNSKKLMRVLDINVSPRTVHRHLAKIDYKYKRASNKIVLSKKHKQLRLDVITSWFSNNHPWESTIFTDEKRFTLDGPDNWMTYMPKNSKYIRQKRQCHGGGVMLWLMIFPNGLLSFHSIVGKFASKDFVQILKKYIVPTIRINFEKNIFFQQDNCTVHTSRLVQDFLKYSNISTIQWPSKSPDLNIVEDVWKIISDMVYDGPQFNNLRELQIRITETIQVINNERRQNIIDLYGSLRARFCKVLMSKGNLYNV